MTSPTLLCLKFNEHLEVWVLVVYTVCNDMYVMRRLKCFRFFCYMFLYGVVHESMNVSDNDNETTSCKLSSRFVRAVRQIVALPPQGMEASTPLNAVAESIGVTSQSGIAQER